MDGGGGDMDMDMGGMSMTFQPWSQYQLRGACVCVVWLASLGCSEPAWIACSAARPTHPPTHTTPQWSGTGGTSRRKASTWPLYSLCFWPSCSIATWSGWSWRWRGGRRRARRARWPPAGWWGMRSSVRASCLGLSSVVELMDGRDGGVGGGCMWVCGRWL